MDEGGSAGRALGKAAGRALGSQADQSGRRTGVCACEWDEEERWAE